MQVCLNHENIEKWLTKYLNHINCLANFPSDPKSQTHVRTQETAISSDEHLLSKSDQTYFTCVHYSWYLFAHWCFWLSLYCGSKMAGLVA